MADATTTAVAPNTSIGTDVAGIWSLIQGLFGSANSNAANLAQVADPQAALRASGITALGNFESNPEAYLQDPVIQASIAQGEEGVSRLQGAAGNANSGGRLAALQQYGQQTAFSDMNTRFNQLFQQAQIGNPVQAANILQQGQTNQATNMAGGIAGVGNMVAQLLGVGGNSGSGSGLVAMIQKLFGSGNSTMPGLTASGGVQFSDAGGGGDTLPDWSSGDITPTVDLSGIDSWLSDAFGA